MAYHGLRGEKTKAVEDEFERFCRAAVNEARQRCGGRRLVAALKPLLVDLVKRRTRDPWAPPGTPGTTGTGTGMTWTGCEV